MDAHPSYAALMHRRWGLTAATLGFTAVGLGALGAHAVKNALADVPDLAQRLTWWDTAAKYHLAHALAVGLIAVVAASKPSRALTVAGVAMTLGVVLFSGSLYLLAVTGARSLGMVTPFGGLAFLSGWVALGAHVWRGR